VNDPVDHRSGDGLVAEHATPTGERQIGREDQRGVFVARGHELEHQVGGVLLERQVADFVDLCRRRHKSTNSASPPSICKADNSCSASSPPPTNAAPSPSHRTGPSTPGDGSYPNTPPPPACSTGSCTTPSSWSPKATATACAKPARKEDAAHHRLLQHEPGWGLSLATTGDFEMAVDTRPVFGLGFVRVRSATGCPVLALWLSIGLRP
jgi:hypothetical protein